jgi:hypothetical protein
MSRLRVPRGLHVIQAPHEDPSWDRNENSRLLPPNAFRWASVASAGHGMHSLLEESSRRSFPPERLPVQLAQMPVAPRYGRRTLTPLMRPAQTIVKENGREAGNTITALTRRYTVTMRWTRTLSHSFAAPGGELDLDIVAKFSLTSLDGPASPFSNAPLWDSLDSPLPILERGQTRELERRRRGMGGLTAGIHPQKRSISTSSHRESASTVLSPS